MDPRLTYKIGKQEFVKSPCVGECAGCSKQFKPITSEDGKIFCLAYPEPAAKWTGKTCPFMYAPKPEKEQKINPIKASKRGIKFSVVAAVASATGSKESQRKN